MKKLIWMASTALVAAAIIAAPAYAGRSKQEQKDQEIQDLKARLEKLEQESAAEKAAADDDRIANGARLKKVEDTQDAVQWTFNDGRPTVRTGDGRFEMSLRGRVQLDFASFMQDDADFGGGYGAVDHCSLTNALCDLGSGAVFRRVRFGIEGKFFRDFVYELRFDFGGTDVEGAGIINIARVGYVGIPGLRIQAGAIQPILSMYDSTSSAELTTMERPQVVTLLVGNFGGDNGRKAVEVTYQEEGLLYPEDNFLISGAFSGDRVATNGTSHSGGPDDERTQLVGRMAYRFWSDGESNAQIGMSAAQINSLQGGTPGVAKTLQLRERPEIRVTGERFIDTGSISLESDAGASVFGFEGGFNFKNLYLAGEWYKFDLDRAASAADPTFTGWYVEGEWIITGENKRYVASGTNNNIAVFRGPSVASPWSMGGGTGAWSIHARYSDMDLNWNEGTAGLATPAGGVRGGEESNTILGVTWYLNSNLKMMAEYNMVSIDRLNGAGASLNADFDVLQGRMMFTF
ncbi:MAG: porin [Micropepsaceae bacterium]